jgi:hypothetical protein
MISYDKDEFSCKSVNPFSMPWSAKGQFQETARVDKNIEN